MSTDLCMLPVAAGVDDRLLIAGKADVYGDNDCDSSDIDTCGELDSARTMENSDFSQHIDSRFQQIMANLSATTTGQVLSAKLTTVPSTSNDDYCTDLESIRTEDIEAEFKSTLISHQFPDTSVIGQSLKPNASPGRHRRRRTPLVKSTVDCDDDENDGGDELTMKGSRPLREQTRTSTIAVSSASIPGPPAAAVYKHVANVPMTSFDRFLVDSDADTVTSYDVRQQFRAAIAGVPRGRTTMADIISVEASVDDDVISQNSSYAGKFCDRGQYDDLPSDRQLTASTDWQWDKQIQTTPIKRAPVQPLQHAVELSRSPQKLAATRSERSSISISEDDVLMTDNNLSMQLAATSTERTRFSSPSRNGAAASSRSSSLDRRQQKQQVTSDHGISADRKGSPPVPVKQNTDLLAIDNKVDLEVSVRLHQELNSLQANIKKSMQTKQQMQEDLKQLEQTIEKRKLEMRSTEKQIKETNKKAEDCRSELMLIEFKQQSMIKELEQLSNNVNQRRLQLQQLETSEKKLQELGFTKEEVTRLILECEELRDRMRLIENADRVKSDLSDQLTVTKEALVAERKVSQEKLDWVKQEVEAKNHQIEELRIESESLQQKICHLELKCKQIEKDKNAFVKETSQEYSNYRTQMEQQMAISRENAGKEMNALRESLNETMEQLTSSRLESNGLSREINELREQLQQQQNDLARQSEMRDQLIAENIKSLKAVINEKELALATFKSQAAEDKRRELENVCKEKQQALRQLESKLSEQVATLQSQLNDKDLEIQTSKERLTQQENLTKQLTERVKEEAYQKFQQLLIEERAKWDREKEAEISLQLLAVRDESDRTTRQLRDDLVHERSVIHSCHRQMDALRTELDEARLALQQSARDKQNAILQLKDSMELEKEHQITMMKDRIEQEMQQAMEKMREAVRRQDDELERQRRERKELQSREEDALRAAEKYEQTILTELQQEYQRLAQAMNKSFKTTNSTGISTSKLNVVSQSAVRSSIASVLASLRMVSDELRQELQQLRQESENQQQAALKLEKQHKAEIEDLRERWQKEKLEALETLKDRLIKTRSGLTGYFDLVDKQRLKKHRTKMTADHDVRMTSSRLDRDTVDRVGMLDTRQSASTGILSSSASIVPGPPVKVHRSPITPPPSVHSDTDVDRLLQQPPSSSAGHATIADLQARINQLQAENGSLRRSGKISSSVPDLTASTETAALAAGRVGSAKQQTAEIKAGGQTIGSPGTMTRRTPPPTSTQIRKDQTGDARHLELAVHRAENRARLAEERIARNDQLLNQKLIETSRLQSTLAQQSKDLMQLQRAYGQFQRTGRCSSPTKSSAPDRFSHTSV